MPEVDQTRATLRLFGEDLDPDQVSKLLQFAPTSAHRKGDSIGRKHKRIAKTGRWSLEAAVQCPGNLDVQITEILSKMTDDLSVWQHLTDEYQVDLFVGVFLKHGNEGISISDDVMLKLGERNIMMDLDIYGGEGECSDD